MQSQTLFQPRQPSPAEVREARGDRSRARRAGGHPGRRPGAGHAAQWLAQHRDATGTGRDLPAWRRHRGGELRPGA